MVATKVITIQGAIVRRTARERPRRWDRTVAWCRRRMPLLSCAARDRSTDGRCFRWTMTAGRASLRGVNGAQGSSFRRSRHMAFRHDFPTEGERIEGVYRATGLRGSTVEPGFSLHREHPFATPI